MFEGGVRGHCPGALPGRDMSEDGVKHFLHFLVTCSSFFSSFIAEFSVSSSHWEVASIWGSSIKDFWVRTLLEDISRGEGGADAGTEEGTEGLTDQHRRWFLLKRETLCANTQHPSDLRRAKRPPKSTSPASSDGSKLQPLGNSPSPQYLGRDLSYWLSANFRALSNAAIESIRCSSQSANLVSFLRLMLSSRVGS